MFFPLGMCLVTPLFGFVSKQFVGLVCRNSKEFLFYLFIDMEGVSAPTESTGMTLIVP